MRKPAKILYSIISVLILVIASFVLIVFSSNNPPMFSNLDEFVLFAEKDLKLDGGIQVLSGNVGTNRRMLVENNVVVNNNLFANNIEIRSDSQINGNVFFNKLAIRENVKILGIQKMPIYLPVANIPDIQIFQLGTQDRTFEEQDNILAAGNYKNIILNQDRGLTLTGGVYNISGLIMKKGSMITFSAPAMLNIKTVLDFQENVFVIPGKNLKPSDLTINYAGENSEDSEDKKLIRFSRNSFLKLKLLAPKSAVKIGEGTTFQGQIIAESIKIGSDAVLGIVDILH